MNQHTRDFVRQALTIVGAVFQVVAAVFAGLATSEIANDLRSTVLPGGYAFAIWTPIFLLAAIYAVWQALPANHENPLARRVGWLIAAGYIGNGICELLFPARQFVLAQLVITAILVVLAVAYVRTSRAASALVSGAAERWLIVMPLGLYFGWITAADCVGLAATLIASGFAATGAGAVAGGAALLLGGGALAVAMVLVGRAGPRVLWLTYAAAVIWALIGVTVNQRETSPVTAGVPVGVAVVVLAVAVWPGTTAAEAWRPVPSLT